MPHGHWHATTFLCGLRADGLVAPLVLDGAVNGPAFLACVEQMLAPALRTGDVVVMDNLGSHKVASVRAAIETRGASLPYLPPYSPDLNPIELAFSQLKPCCALPRPAPWTPFGASSLASWIASLRPNASAISATAAMHSQADKGLGEQTPGRQVGSSPSSSIWNRLRPHREQGV